MIVCSKMLIALLSEILQYMEMKEKNKKWREDW